VFGSHRTNAGARRSSNGYGSCTKEKV
ncbi:uncharacterized protein METZ01_LOCUS275039, partial [marine metagenome]